MIHSKLQATNERFNKIFKDMGKLTKSLELTQDQHDDELGNVRKRNRKIRSKHQMCGEQLFRPRWSFIRTNITPI